MLDLTIIMIDDHMTFRGIKTNFGRQFSRSPGTGLSIGSVWHFHTHGARVIDSTVSAGKPPIRVSAATT
jgi:hypothetical protein